MKILKYAVLSLSYTDIRYLYGWVEWRDEQDSFLTQASKNSSIHHDLTYTCEMRRSVRHSISSILFLAIAFGPITWSDIAIAHFLYITIYLRVQVLKRVTLIAHHCYSSTFMEICEIEKFEKLYFSQLLVIMLWFLFDLQLIQLPGMPFECVIEFMWWVLVLSLISYIIRL